MGFVWEMEAPGDGLLIVFCDRQTMDNALKVASSEPSVYQLATGRKQASRIPTTNFMSFAPFIVSQRNFTSKTDISLWKRINVSFHATPEELQNTTIT